MKNFAIRLLDIGLFPLALVSGIIMAIIRRMGVHRLPASRRAVLWMGVFPIRRHYYEPLFDTEPLRDGLTKQRELPGIDFNVAEQVFLFLFGVLYLAVAVYCSVLLVRRVAAALVARTTVIDLLLVVRVELILIAVLRCLYFCMIGFGLSRDFQVSG